MKNSTKSKRKDKSSSWLAEAPAWEHAEVRSHLNQRRGILTAAFLPAPVPLEEARRRRQAGEPLEYILRHCHVDALTLGVDPRVLIPRQETETLARMVVEAIPDLPPGPVIDCGTGSGFLGGWIREHTARPVVATDLEGEALEVAAENSRRNHWGLRLIQADRLEAFGGTAAVVVANLPYVEASDSIQPSVLRYEPARALFCSEDPIPFFRTLLRSAAGLLTPGGELFLELKNPLVRSLRALALRDDRWARVRAVNDLAGHTRFLRMRRSRRHPGSARL